MENLLYKTESIWEKTSVKIQKEMKEFAKKYIKFMSHVKTERECVDYVLDRLEKEKFNTDVMLYNKKDTFVTSLHGKTLFATRKGKRPLSDGVRLISAHTDSPRLDFKQHPLLETAGIGQAKTHYYGGIRKYQWLARPLALHGVVVKESGEVVKICIGEKADEPVFTITDLLPHLAQDHSTKTLAKAFDAEKLNIILGHAPYKDQEEKAKSSKQDKQNKTGKQDIKIESPIKTHILKILHKKYGIIEEDLLSAEIQAVPAGEARFVGLDESLIGAYGHDDRICVFTALEAFLEAKTPEYTTCIIFWDKEEIGSEGSTGASSRFFEYCMQDMIEAWSKETSLSKVMLQTRAISADVHAATDPDWQELHEKLNSSIIGHGPTICKFTGSRGKYGANDAHPEYVAWLRQIFAKKDIPWQMAALGKVDHGGGGTVALFLAVYGMNVIDMGPSLLGMHSPFEIASVADLYYSKEAYQTFFEAK